MENLALYEKLRSVPETAKKQIGGGRLKGMTDINPMWRIKKLTETFGAVGIGWYYTIDKQWIEAGAEGVVMAFTNISLYYKQDGEWSMGIPGTGGSALVSKEQKSLYNDDEAFKKSLTDAIGVACKALGVGADVYWDKDATKYDKPASQEQNQLICPQCGKPINGIKLNGNVYTPNEVANITGGSCYHCYAERFNKDETAV